MFEYLTLWRKCVFDQCESLLKHRNGQIAAMSLLCSYFEAIWIHLSGEDSKGKSGHFFASGFCRVFSADNPEIRRAADAVYAFVRCGLAHEGFMRRKVNYGDAGAKAFVLTYHKKADGSLDIDRGVVSVAVNPYRVLEGVKRHFEQYLADLRNPEKTDIRSAFQKSVVRLWGPGGEENVIGMTETEFTGNAQQANRVRAHCALDSQKRGAFARGSFAALGRTKRTAFRLVACAL